MRTRVRSDLLTLVGLIWAVDFSAREDGERAGRELDEKFLAAIVRAEILGG